MITLTILIVVIIVADDRHRCPGVGEVSVLLGAAVMLCFAVVVVVFVVITVVGGALIWPGIGG